LVPTAIVSIVFVQAFVLRIRLGLMTWK